MFKGRLTRVATKPFFFFSPCYMCPFSLCFPTGNLVNFLDSKIYKILACILTVKTVELRAPTNSFSVSCAGSSHLKNLKPGNK